MSRRESNPLYKLIVLGDGGVGKTALTIQLCLNHFVETYDPTIEDSYRKQVIIDDQPATLEVLDTAGQEEYTALRDQWIRDGEGFILVYSITSRSSFSRIKNYYSQIERVKDEDPFAVVLVGNKSDRKGERQVSESEGEELAQELGDNVAFFESSAKLNINIEKAFFECARKCRLIRNPGLVIDTNDSKNINNTNNNYNDNLPNSNNYNSHNSYLTTQNNNPIPGNINNLNQNNKNNILDDRNIEASSGRPNVNNNPTSGSGDDGDRRSKRHDKHNKKKGGKCIIM